MKVKTTAEAWRKANELFPTDYMKDDVLSERAGYPQYYSTSPEHSDDHINDLNCRLEVCVDGNCTNIWIEELIETDEHERVQMSKKLYTDIWLLIGEQINKADREIEQQLQLLDCTDHLDPDNGELIRCTVDRIKICRDRKNKYTAMQEQFEKEVEE